MLVETPNITQPLTHTASLPKDWTPATDRITADDVIDAYFKGKEDGKEAHFEKLKQDFFLNLKTASSIAEELFEMGQDQDLHLQEMHLKVDGFNSFNILYLVDENIYDSPKFREAYILSRVIKNKWKSDRLNINFSFTALSESLSINCLATDGYFLRYGQGAKA
jgi:hypothetical protein